MTTTEKNRLIAEFMGMKPHNENELEGFWTNTIKTHQFDNVMDLKFHKDWNWLMEVVCKIESLGHCQIDISFNWCRIGYKDTLFNYDSRNYFKGLTKIEAVYNAVVKFIKFYNQTAVKE